MSHEPKRTSAARAATRTLLGYHSGFYRGGCVGIIRISASEMRLSMLYGGKATADSFERSNSMDGPVRTPDQRNDFAETLKRARKKNERGFLVLGGSLVLLVAMIGFGFWMSLIHIRAIAERQITLDRCSGRAILALRSQVKRMESSYLRLEASRLALLPLLPTPAAPEAIRLFRVAAEIEEKVQLALKAEWSLQQSRWNLLTGLGCRIRDQPWRSPFPDFPFPIVNPNLSIFEIESTSFQATLPNEFRLGIRVAQLSTEATLKQDLNHDWTVRWTQ